MLTQQRAQQILLGLLLAGCCAAAVLAPWRSTMVVDDRTYLEMIVGIDEHGLPYRLNGPVDRFAELRAQWNIRDGQRLWGKYPPLYPYLAWPIYRAGGTRAVIGANIACLGLLALAVFALVRRFAPGAWEATVAAYAVLLVAPVWTFTSLVSPYTFAITTITWAVYAALRGSDGAAEARAQRRWLLLAGALAGLGCAMHLLCAPLLLGLGVSLWLIDERGRLRLLPDRARVRRVLLLAAGALPPLLSVAAFNAMRFATFNPLSYGGCPWRHCPSLAAANENLSAMLTHITPLLVWLVVSAVVVRLLWRRYPRAGLVALVLALLVLVPDGLLRQRALSVGRLLWSYLIDGGALFPGGDYWRRASGPGLLLGRHVVKSLLQTTPLFSLAAALVVATGHLGDAQLRRRTRLVALPALLFFCVVALQRANQPLLFGLAHPYLHYRYGMFAAPLLVALSMVALGRLQPRPWHIIVAVLLAIGLGAWLLSSDRDYSAPRRYLLLWGSLTLAALLGLAALRAEALALEQRRMSRRRFAALVGCLALATSVATTVGVDGRAIVQLRQRNDAVLAAVERHTPARFALVGWSVEIDQALGLLGRRDVQYADLYEAESGVGDLRALAARWLRRGRPVFAVVSRRRRLSSRRGLAFFEIADHGARAAGVRLYRVAATDPPRTADAPSYRGRSR